jgi:ribokinase
MAPEIVVLGNHGIGGNIVRVHHIPVVGETVIAWDFHFHKDGGKGSHQAIVVNRLGGKAALIGKIGRDERSDTAVQWLVDDGVDIKHLLRSDLPPQPIGLKMIDDNGDNAIVSIKGSLHTLEFDEVKAAIEAYGSAKIFITGFEIPVKTALDGARLAKELGMTTILNPAPAPQEELGLLDYIDIIIPNESEAKSIAGVDPHTGFQPYELLTAIKEKYQVSSVIITGGGEGVFGLDGDRTWKISAIPVKVVDTIGAGDAFIGGFAWSLSNGDGIVKASQVGNVVAAISVSREGTIPAFPTLKEIQEFIETKSQHLDISLP